MRIGNRAYGIDWGHLALATLIAGVSLAYLLDARATSLNIQNLLLVQPTTLLVLLMYVLIIPQCLREKTGEEPSEPRVPGEITERRSALIRRVLLAAAFEAFIMSVETIGYDVGAYLFTLAGLVICGERRPLALILIPPVFAAIVILGFKAMVPYPMVTRLL